MIDIPISEFKELMLAKNSGNAGIDFLFSVHLFQIIQDILICHSVHSGAAVLTSSLFGGQSRNEQIFQMSKFL